MVAFLYRGCSSSSNNLPIMFSILDISSYSIIRSFSSSGIVSDVLLYENNSSSENEEARESLSSVEVCSFGVAILTSTHFPFIQFESQLSRTFSADSSFANVTKPKPRGFPVDLSSIIIESSNSPNQLKQSLNSSLVREYGIPPTKTFLDLWIGVSSGLSWGTAHLQSIDFSSKRCYFAPRTASAARRVRIVMKPKQRDFPVNLLCISTQSSTLPKAEKCFNSATCVVLMFKPPINSFR